ncbi:MAG: putative 7-carboxy-7-deazaguanine synthase QueE [Christensenellales bacterium]|uniref:putative 7-carboxy-7-deazaguanine synthase QueE n=1 Tax=Butyribacter sp. TaxID=2822465 RepID=UPI0003349360|nr:putative 7-carboxy-7-deazaguanine synthase QueE [Clostridium sp.]MDY5179603.1 putative 7-carboxy-7-deazaguanine synthase QueE [Butyribacter sp.]CDB90455.1 7-carboxy-7-deazaguanine synthase [Clostridium sp. CAG:253]
MSFKVVEIFESINGEGMRAGELAVFVRMKGCNLSCNYCDTMWANEADCEFEEMTADRIVERVKKSGIKNVTLTGGEPLLQKDADKLLKLFSDEKDIRVEIETNGSVNLSPFLKYENTSFTMDYKLPESDMEKYMDLENFKILRKKDTLKFVASSVNDLKKAKDIIEKYDLIDRVNIIFSPVFGKIELTDIVDFLKDNKLNDVRMQLQMHKFIWAPDERGV